MIPSELSPAGTVVASALWNNASLRGAPAIEVARRLRLPLSAVREGMAGVVGAADRLGASRPPVFEATESRTLAMAPWTSTDHALARFASHAANPTQSASPLYANAAADLGTDGGTDGGGGTVRDADPNQRPGLASGDNRGAVRDSQNTKEAPPPGGGGVGPSPNPSPVEPVTSGEVPWGWIAAAAAAAAVAAIVLAKRKKRGGRK